MNDLKDQNKLSNSYIAETPLRVTKQHCTDWSRVGLLPGLTAFPIYSEHIGGKWQSLIRHRHAQEQSEEPLCGGEKTSVVSDVVGNSKSRLSSLSWLWSLVVSPHSGRVIALHVFLSFTDTWHFLPHSASSRGKGKQSLMPPKGRCGAALQCQAVLLATEGRLVWLGGFPYKTRAQKKGYPYSNLSTGGPRGVVVKLGN